MGQLLILIRGVKFFFLHSNRWVLKSRFLSMEFLDKLGSKKKLQLTKARYAHSFSLDPKCGMILLKWVGAILGWENRGSTLKPWYSEQVRQTLFVHYIKYFTDTISNVICLVNSQNGNWVLFTTSRNWLHRGSLYHGLSVSIFHLAYTMVLQKVNKIHISVPNCLNVWYAMLAVRFYHQAALLS